MKKGSICLLLCLLLTGCAPAPAQRSLSSQVVRQITVTAESCGHTTRRYYNTNGKMQQLLLYIRKLSPLFATDADPESLTGRTICITMTCADGTRHIYRQKNDRYFQTGTGPWQKIAPGKNSDLWRILLRTPSDPRPARLTGPPLPRLPGLRIRIPDLAPPENADK